MPSGLRATASQGLVPTKTPSLDCADGLAGGQVATRISDNKASSIDTILFIIILTRGTTREVCRPLRGLSYSFGAWYLGLTPQALCLRALRALTRSLLLPVLTPS